MKERQQEPNQDKTKKLASNKKTKKEVEN